jgi:EAL domain-containing protein (putative c-di-GMP-specific phosphodiesterase class I)
MSGFMNADLKTPDSNENPPDVHVRTKSGWFLAAIGNTQVANSEMIAIDAIPFSVGRKPGCALQLGARTVSGHHADLMLQNGSLVLVDRGSTNGTFVNGQRVTLPTVLSEDTLIQFADVAFRVRRNQSTDASQTIAENVCDRALALVQFDRLLQDRLVTPFFQPIIDLKTMECKGYEILARSRLFGLENPDAMFDAASKLSLEVELSHMLRWEGVLKGLTLPGRPCLFVNTHPLELNSGTLVESMVQIRQLSPEIPLVLEIHESAVTSPHAVGELTKQIRDLNIRIAYDDFGAGQGRLAELGESPPDILKFDMSLLHNIDTATSERQRVLQSLVAMVLELGVEPLAEGIETPAEAKVCREMGFVTAQGFLFGRPAPMR